MRRQKREESAQAHPPASTPDRVGIPVLTVETQMDIQLGTEVWILHQGSTGNGSANSDRDIHAWDIVESSDEDGSDEDDNESCSDDGDDKVEDCHGDSRSVMPISRVTDKSEDDNALELDVIAFESDDDREEVCNDNDDRVDSKEPQQYHDREEKLTEYSIDDSENPTPPLPGVKLSDTRKGRATHKQRARATKRRFNAFYEQLPRRL